MLKNLSEWCWQLCFASVAAADAACGCVSAPDIVASPMHLSTLQHMTE